MRRPSARTVTSLIAVGGSVAFVLWQLHPSLLLLNTTTTGGDLGAHVDLPAFLRSHLLPAGRLTGWSPDWYDGYPALTFYFPLPSLLIALASYVIPYDIAFKLVTALGLLTLPVAAWAFGRLSGMRRPFPECLAVATLPFMFDTTYTIYGGNVASTMAGEYSFSLALSTGMVFLGLVSSGLRTGRHRALAAALLAVTALCHMIPTLFVGFGALVLVLMPSGRTRLVDRLRWAIPVAVVGAAITGFWSIPFILRQQYSTNMGWEKVTSYMSTLFPSSQHWVVGLAVAGALASVALRRRTGVFLAIMAVVSAAAFVLTPQGKLYNARLLPFWVLCIYLLAGVAVAELGGLVASLTRLLVTRQARLSVTEYWEAAGSQRPEPAPDAGLHPGVAATERPEPSPGSGRLAQPVAPSQDAGPDPAPGPASSVPGHASSVPGPGARGHRRRARLAPGALLTPVVAFAAAAVFVLLPLVDLPSWFPLSVTKSVVPDWVHWDYEGYQRKASYPEYRSLLTTMERVGAQYGCGRAMWEYEPEEVRFGTTMGLMLLPYWSNGCIDSEEGLLFESSATTPYHFIDQSELSYDPSRAMVGLPYGPLDVAAGVQHLQMLGVRYYMAVSPEAEAQANADPDLKLVATSGPWSVTYGNHVESRTWDIYEVADSAQVSPMSFDPAVLTGLAKGAKPWLDASVSWYDDPNRFEIPLAANGPPDWPRVSVRSDQSPPRRRVAPASVSHIVTTSDSISFDVDRTGSPVLVKTSYFPNWQATGASGPWRVTPNLMAVVPTSKHVTLNYGYTPVDDLGWAVTLLGIAGLAWLALGRRVLSRRRRPAARRAAREARQVPGTLGHKELVGTDLRALSRTGLFGHGWK